MLESLISSITAHAHPARAIRVLIADDQSLVRRGLAAIINMEEGIEVIGEAGNGLEAIELWRALPLTCMTISPHGERYGHHHPNS